MGTNYYIRSQTGANIEGLDTPEWHIGKSSAGWVFALHVDNKIKSFEDITKVFFNEYLKSDGSRIYEEYGDSVHLDIMINIIAHRKSWWTSLDGAGDFCSFCDTDINLMRRKVGINCVANGEGTYDLIEGEFS